MTEDINAAIEHATQHGDWAAKALAREVQRRPRAVVFTHTPVYMNPATLRPGEVLDVTIYFDNCAVQLKSATITSCPLGSAETEVFHKNDGSSEIVVIEVTEGCSND